MDRADQCLHLLDDIAGCYGKFLSFRIFFAKESTILETVKI